MKYKVIEAIAAIAGLTLLCSQPAPAGPMTCSGELQTCISNCTKNAAFAAAATCIANCRVRQSMCRQTGCWDNGVNKYCGLLRQ